MQIWRPVCVATLLRQAAPDGRHVAGVGRCWARICPPHLNSSSSSGSGGGGGGGSGGHSVTGSAGSESEQKKNGPRMGCAPLTALIWRPLPPTSASLWAAEVRASRKEKRAPHVSDGRSALPASGNPFLRGPSRQLGRVDERNRPTGCLLLWPLACSVAWPPGCPAGPASGGPANWLAWRAGRPSEVERPVDSPAPKRRRRRRRPRTTKG